MPVTESIGRTPSAFSHGTPSETILSNEVSRDEFSGAAYVVDGNTGRTHRPLFQMHDNIDSPVSTSPL